MDAPFSVVPGTQALTPIDSAQLIGRKAAQLCTLPVDWVPRFVVITTAAYERWARQASEDASSEPYVEELSAQLNLPQLLAEVTAGEHTSLIARSSADTESLRDRGRYHSYRCQSDLRSVVEAVLRVWRDFYRQQASGRMAVVIQRFVDPVAVGHLSNERRVSRFASDWLCEIEDSLQQTSRHTRFRAGNGLSESSPLDLACSNSEQLENRLKAIARLSSAASERTHIEWEWDGARLWILQFDSEPDTYGTPPGQQYGTVTVPKPIRSLSILATEEDATGNWQKIEAVRIFRACGLPTAQVFVLEDGNVIRDLASGRVPTQLRNDLQELLRAPIVIRTDIESVLPKEHFLLPRTESIREVNEACSFLAATAQKLVADGVPPESLCFILHRFITATACAQALGRPDVARVRIDSTWGLPDGLQFYPHDSFEVDAAHNRIVRRHHRAKIEYLDVDADGKWIEKRAGRPWDWKPSLSVDQLLKIANATRAIASQVRDTVDVMFFVGVDPATGHPPCLPWFLSREKIQEASPVEQTRFVGQRILVATDQDVDSLTERLVGGGGVNTISVRLKPIPEFLRSESLLKQLSDLSKQYRFSIELEGSILSHAYYVLSRSGARVRCIDPFIHRSRRQRFGKLVRNLIPLRIESRGEKARARKVSATQLARLLKVKAVEESLELCAESDPTKTLDELADVLEVIRTVCVLYGWNFDELLATAERKRSERGGFEQGIVLVETEEVPLLGSGPQNLFPTPAEQHAESRVIDSATNSDVLDGVRRVRSTGRGLVVSLVPPDSFAVRRDARVPIRGLGMEALVRYMQKEVVITIQPITEAMPDRQQLLLPFGRNR